eukprot:TRINITY_DN21536_c0_g1_i1.p1 TRINITY_DN21536_c0_g1~~TRINITY_DN21536_c0_g1_i1.p1  ORF type:complete len:505 (-),score=32.79 TRINITY_DN21536_c0_g1_i1:38-1552(-)
MMWISPVLIHYTAGGAYASGLMIIWCLLSPSLALALDISTRVCKVYMLLTLVFVGVSVVVTDLLDFTTLRTERNTFSQAAQRVIVLINMIIPGAVSWFATGWYIQQTTTATAANTQLLLQILPASVTGALLRGDRHIVSHHEHCTVIFADMANFTLLMNKYSDQAVLIVQHIFSAVDHLTIANPTVQKIKTVGDCYMAACGVPESSDRHALAALEFSVGVLIIARLYNIEHQTSADDDFYINFRVGLHTGSLLAGVVGIHKFSFDVWGNTVELASRMESGGVVGSIQMTEAVIEACKEQCKPPGTENLYPKLVQDLYEHGTRRQVAVRKELVNALLYTPVESEVYLLVKNKLPLVVFTTIAESAQEKLADVREENSTPWVPTAVREVVEQSRHPHSIGSRSMPDGLHVPKHLQLPKMSHSSAGFDESEVSQLSPTGGNPLRMLSSSRDKVLGIRRTKEKDAVFDESVIGGPSSSGAAYPQGAGRLWVSPSAGASTTGNLTPPTR